MIDFLKKYEMLIFWNRCRINRKKADFRDMVINGYNSPDFLKVNHNPEGKSGEIAYLIHEEGNGVGFWGEIVFALEWLYFADERGLKPYISWGKNHLYYEENGVKGETNVFQYYFDPVSDIKDIGKCAFWIESLEVHNDAPLPLREGKRRISAEVYIAAMSAIMKKYVHLREDVEKRLKDESENILKNKKTIGVHYRGTDFHMHYNNHPVPVDIEQVVEQVQKLMKQDDYTQVFLATDEKDAIKKMESYFGDKLVCYKDVFRESEGDSIAFSSSDREKHHYLLGMEVLRDAYTLAKCDALICGDSNVSYGAKLIKKAWFEKEFGSFILINNGIYHNENVFSKSGHAPQR